MENRVKVGVRIRPLSVKETEEGNTDVVRADSNRRLCVRIPSSKQTKFDYDWVYDINTSTRAIYEQLAAPLIENVFNGFNGTIFAYGQTGSGKTHTMGGQNDGIIFLAIEEIFKRVRSYDGNDSRAEISVSFLEIYKEECFDLLSSHVPISAADGPQTSKPIRVALQLRELNGLTVVDGLSTHAITQPQEAFQILQRATEQRHTNKTAMNTHSSRSHSLCTLTVKITSTSPASTLVQSTTVSKLHLVDLAGSERAKKTLATGDIFNEGVSINKGLLALGNVVAALAAKSHLASEQQQQQNPQQNQQTHIHVPYRESKLTRLLKDSLGGNGLTVLLACVSPSDAHTEETLNTLKFANRALAVVNHAQVNREETNNDDLEARQQILDLKQQLKSLQMKCDLLTAQQLLHQQPTQVQTSTTSARETYTQTQLSAGLLMLATSLKNILRQNFEEDVDLKEDELWVIHQQINALKTSLQSEDTVLVHQHTPQSESEEMNGIEMGMPPILVVMETIMSLEDLLNQSLHPNNTNNSNHEANKTSNSEFVVGSVSDGSQQGQLDQLTKEKEQELTTLMTLTVTVEESLESLRKEIAQLEADKRKIQSQQQQKHPQQQQQQNQHQLQQQQLLKQQLKEKQQLLDQKLQQLRSKEKECNSLHTQRDKTTHELENLQHKLQHAHTHQVQLIKQLQAQTQSHCQERQQHHTQEAQLRRQEMIAQLKVAKLERQLMQKEIVFREQLQKAQAQSSQQLKQQAAKQQHQLKSSTKRNALTSAHPTSQQLEALINTELARQMQIHTLRQELTKTMSKRTVVAKQLAALKLSQPQEDENVNVLESEMKGLSLHIAELQAEIAAMDSNTDVPAENSHSGNQTTLMNSLTTLHESKAVIGMLFSRLIEAQRQQQQQPIQTELVTTTCAPANSNKRKLEPPTEQRSQQPSKQQFNKTNTSSAVPLKRPMLAHISSNNGTNAANNNSSADRKGLTSATNSNNNKARLPLHAPKTNVSSGDSANGAARKLSSLAQPHKQPAGVVGGAKPIIKSVAFQSNKSNNSSSNNSNRAATLAATASAMTALTFSLSSAPTSAVATTESGTNPNTEKDEEEGCSSSEGEYYDSASDDDSDYSGSGGYDELDESFYPDQEEDGQGEEDDDDEEEYVYRRRRPTNKRKARATPTAFADEDDGVVGSAHLHSNRPSTDSTQSDESHTTADIDDDEEEDELGDTNSSDSDASSDDDDEDNNNRKKHNSKRQKNSGDKKPPTKARAPKKQKLEVAVDDTAGDEDLQQQKESVDLMNIVKYKPLSKHTVAELKSLLKSCGCVMTGLKEDLIKRLEQQLLLQQEKHQQQQEQHLMSFLPTSTVEVME